MEQNDIVESIDIVKHRLTEYQAVQEMVLDQCLTKFSKTLTAHDQMQNIGYEYNEGTLNS